jgi:hypothetical protein
MSKNVKDKAINNRKKVRIELDIIMAELRSTIEENSRFMRKAPRGKEGSQVLEQMKTEMATIDASVFEAQGMYDKGAYMDALNKVKATKERATAINTELRDAISKVKGKY